VIGLESFTKTQGTPAMFEWVFDYQLFYYKFLMNWWNTLGPVGYTSILTLVGVGGFWAMRKGPNSPL